MLKLKHVRKTYYVAVQDEQAIQSIRDKYGLSTDSDAVRLALRLVAESAGAQIVKKRVK